MSHHLGSGDERVPSISPPLEGVSVPLISSSNSNTPTKSILKKPKHYSTNATPTGQEALYSPMSRSQPQEDQSSQSSSGKDERFSESSNVSFSDRDTPTIDQAAATAMVGPLQPIPPLASQDEDEDEEEDKETVVDDDDDIKGYQPNYSPSNTYLETSFEAAAVATPTKPTNDQDSSSAAKKMPPPTLPKPASTDLSEKVVVGASSTTTTTTSSSVFGTSQGGASTGSMDKLNGTFNANTIDRKVRNITQV